MSDNLSLQGGVLTVVPGSTTGIAYSTWPQSPPQVIGLQPIVISPEGWIKVISAAIGTRFKMLRQIIVVHTKAQPVDDVAIIDCKVACEAMALAHGAALFRISAAAATVLAYNAGVKVDDVTGMANAVSIMMRSGDLSLLHPLILVNEARQHDRTDARDLARLVHAATPGALTA